MLHEKDEVRKLIMLAKDKGYITYKELEEVLDEETLMSEEELDKLIDYLNELNIEVMDNDKVLDEDSLEGEQFLGMDLSDDVWSKTDDPVKLYLKEMGKIPLLTREEEIRLSMEIERGRKKVFRGLLRTSFLAERLLDEWARITEGKMKVRDLINLDNDMNEFDDDDSVNENDTLDPITKEFIQKGLKLAIMYRELKDLEQEMVNNPDNLEIKKEFLRKHAKLNRFIKSLNIRFTKLDKIADELKELYMKLKRKEKDLAKRIKRLQKIDPDINKLLYGEIDDELLRKIEESGLSYGRFEILKTEILKLQEEIKELREEIGTVPTEFEHVMKIIQEGRREVKREGKMKGENRSKRK
ncbi:MAG: RNA polymerase sigma factor RpoD, partial [Persephonella sp.]